MYNFATGMSTVASWAVPSPISISFWITLRGFNGGGSEKFIGTGDDFESKYLNSTNKYYIDLFEAAGSAMPSSPSGLNNRVHLAFTGTLNGTVKSYLNGVLDVTSGTVTDSPTSPATLGVGGRPGSSNPANGDMEDVRIYNRELVAAEVKNIYESNGRDNIVDGLINRWAVTSKGDGTDIGTDYIYDLTTSRQHLQKSAGNIYYRGGFLNPRRRV